MQHHPDRKNFQVDRMILFTDAVFAIAITLMVLSFTVPDIPSFGTDEDFLQGMLLEMPKFFGFIISFFLVGLYWYLHHKTFGFVVNYTPQLIWLNLVFLFFVVLMPYSTSVYSEYSLSDRIHLQAPYGIYVANVCCLGIMDFTLRRYVFNVKNGVATIIPSKEDKMIGEKRALVIPIIFLISWIVSFATPIIGRFLLFMIPVVNKFVGKRKMNKSKA